MAMDSNRLQQLFPTPAGIPPEHRLEASIL